MSVQTRYREQGAASDGLHRPYLTWPQLAQIWLQTALRDSYLTGGRGHLQSRQVLRDRRTGRDRGRPAEAERGGSLDGTDAESSYLSRLACQPRLTSSEEYRLARSMRRGDQAARHALIEAHLGLVVMFARRYQRSGVPLLDLVAEGNFGLMAATKTFDPERGYRFSTYAKWAIRQAIQRAIPKLSSLIRTPAGRSTREDDVGPGGHEPVDDLDHSPESLALDACGIDPGRPGAGMGSFDLDFLQLQCDNLAECIPIPEDLEPPNLTHQGQVRATLARALQELSERERSIVCERFALTGDAAATLEHLAGRYGVSIERIRQIESAALRKLEKALRGAGWTAQTIF